MWLALQQIYLISIMNWDVLKGITLTNVGFLWPSRKDVKTPSL